MHGKKVMFWVLACSVLLLQACGNSNNEENALKTDSGQNTGVHETMAEGQEMPGESETLSLKLLTRENPLAVVTASSKKGAYTSRVDFSGGNTQLMYIDYATQTELPLSNNLSGVYGSDEDTSWFEKTINISPYLINDQLYVFSNTDKGDWYDIDLYHMDIDGKNRQKVYTWDASTLMSSGMAVSDDALYVNVSYYADDGEHSRIEALNLNTGKTETVYEQTDQSDMGTAIVGAYENDLLIYDSEAGKVEEGGSENDIFLKSTYRLWRFDVLTKARTKILEWGFCETTYCVEDNYLYYIDQQQHAVMKMNWIDDKRESVLTDETLFDGRRITSNSDVYEGHWYIFDGEDLYIVDLGNKNITKMLLKAKGTVVNTYMKILGISEDKYMVCIRDEVDSATGGLNYVYAMIDKDDFWNNRENYEEISLISE